MSTINWEKFSAEERTVIERLDATRLPRHIAVIMDGNGRWATQQGLPRVIGHHAGVESVRAMIRTCRDLGVSYLTLYSFSTENWSRPDTEVTALMSLIEEQLRTEMEGLHEEGVRIRHLGRLDGLPASLRETLRASDARTRNNTALNLIFAINYSGRAELLDAVRGLAAAAAAGTLDPQAIVEDDLMRALYLPDVPAPDLLIRTGGEMRISNYLLWQIAYTEFWFTPLLWPEFRTMHLLLALEEYQSRQRKFGRISS